MSPGRRPNAGSAKERLVLDPAERKAALLGVIGAARRRLVLSLFRCDDFSILDALASAARTRVRSGGDSHQARQGRQEAAEKIVGRARGNGRRGDALRRSGGEVPRQVPRRRRHHRDHHHPQPDAEVFHAHLGRGADHAGSHGGEGPADAVSGRLRRQAAAVAPADQPASHHRPRAIARRDPEPHRRRQEQYSHPRSQAVGSRRGVAAARAPRRGHCGDRARQAADKRVRAARQDADHR